MRASRRVSVSLVVGLVAIGLLTPVATPVAASSHDACPPGQVPATGFSDTVGSTHRAAIDCAVWWGIAQGRSATSFVPGGAITRGQTAAMIARLLRETGAVTGDALSAGFQDVGGHTFEADIDLLASSGVIAGLSDTSFGPDLPIRRDQMASILDKMFALGFETPLPDGPAPFGDVPESNVHHAAIGRLVAAGIAAGTTATTYGPAGVVVRGQMASFLTRAASRLVADGRATPPEPRVDVTDAYTSKVRAAWVHLFDDTLKSRTGIRALVDELVVADANLVIAQVARRHDAYYTSEVLPRTVDPRLEPGLDVLDELLTAAHAVGIQVHAWISVAPTYHDNAYRDLTPPPGWVHTEHGPGAPVADRWVTRVAGADGAWSQYLDPGVPAVHDHVATIVGELASSYPLDGIHLDYVRYQSPQHGYNPIALERYRAETGATGTPAPTDPLWSDWRRQQTRQIIRRARAAIADSGRDVALSAAVITWTSGPESPTRDGFRGASAFRQTLQDWDAWVREGDIDIAFPMNYYQMHHPRDPHPLWFERWMAYQERLAAESDALVVPGIAGYLNRPPAGLGQVAQAMNRADGAVVYSYQQPTLDESRAIWAQLAGTRWGYAPAG